MKAYEVMTHALATCPPDASVSTVASIMRDRDIGNVLIMDDGKLSGIVTDRDLAIQALTGAIDPMNTPITKFMNTRVVKGEADWSLEKVADVMAKNQIRRLPIVRDDQLVGIISLGDLALYESRKDVVSKSLKAISNPIPVTGSRAAKVGGSFLTFLFTAALATTVLWLTFNRSGKEMRKKIGKSDLYHNAQDVVSTARDKVGEKVGETISSKQVRELTHQMRSNINDLTSQVNVLASHVPMLDGKASKRKHFLFG